MPPAAASTRLSVSIWRTSRAASCAKRRAHAELALARGAPRQQQIRDVDAGDEQHERTAPTSANSAGRSSPTICSCRWKEHHRPAGIALRLLFLELGEDAPHLAVRLLERNAVAQPRDARTNCRGRVTARSCSSV